MAIVSCGIILDEIARFEQGAERFYADLRDRTANDGVRLLTYYLAKRKKNLPQAFAQLHGEEVTEVRLFPVMVAEDQIPGLRFFEELRLPDSANADQLLDAAIAITQTLLSLYEKVVNDVAAGPVHALFRTLTVFEERAIVELKKIRAMNYF